MQKCHMVRVRDGVAYPELVGLLMENGEQCSVFEVLGIIPVVMSSR